MIYRRPPAQPEPVDQTGSAWFGDEADAGASADSADEEPSGNERPAPAFGPGTPSGYSRTSFGFTDGPISPVRPGSAPDPRSPARSGDAPALSDARFSARSGDAPALSDARQPDVMVWPPPTRVDTPDLDRVAGTPAAEPGRHTGEQRAVPREPIGLDEPGFDSSRFDPPRFDPQGFVSQGLVSQGFVSQGFDSPGVGPSSSAAPDSRDFDSRDYTGEQRALRRETTGDQRASRRDVVGSPRAPHGETTGEQRPPRREAPAQDESFRPRQSRLVTVGIVVLSAIVLLAGAAVGVMYFSGSDGKLDSVLELGAGGSDSRTVTAPLDNRTKASFEVLAATNRVTVRIGELGEDLYRISTPEDAGIRPSPTIRNDDVKLQVAPDGDGTGGEIEVTLAARVQWSLRFSGYAEEQTIDVSGGQISDLAMVGASRRTALLLPRPSGTVPVRITAAVEELSVRSPAGSPVRVNVAAGAGKVVAGSRTIKDVPAGSTLTPKDWATQNRYDVTAAARITALSVENA